MKGKDEEVHVVMLPWLAFGHMIPFLELAIALAKSQIHTSFLSTPRNIQRLPKIISPTLANFIHFVSLPLPNHSSHPLPLNAEASIDVSSHNIDSLKIAFDLMQLPIKNFIAQKSPHWIITDFASHWAADISQDLHIPLIFYSVFSCSTNLFFGSPENLAGDGQKQLRSSPESLASPPPWLDFPSKVSYNIDEASFVLSGFYGVNATGISDSGRIARVIGACTVVAIRSCPEFEGDALRLFSKLTGKTMIPVGLLPPPIEAPAMKQEPWSSVFEWLGKQNPRSVVFVGFGSETKMRREEIHEIAYGLELSKLPFVWALRLAGDEDVDAALPADFRRRTAGQGVVEGGWAPQREILAHSSIGGVFFHAGWGSIIEALQFGHVLICMPLIIDQPLNARLMVEKELGVETQRGAHGSFSRDNIANSIREAMFSDELRARAGVAARHIFGDHQLHQTYAQKFAQYLKDPHFNLN